MKSIIDLINELQAALPSGDLIPRQDIKRLLESIANRMDLVTRDQFDAQTAVLQRTREMLEALEAKVAQLESQQQKMEAQ